MVNKRYKNRFLLLKLLSKKTFLLYFFVLAAKWLTHIILENFALLHQMIMFVHVIFVLVGIVIYFFRGQFICNDCLLFNRF